MATLLASKIGSVPFITGKGAVAKLSVKISEQGFTLAGKEARIRLELTTKPDTNYFTIDSANDAVAVEIDVPNETVNITLINTTANIGGASGTVATYGAIPIGIYQYAVEVYDPGLPDVDVRVQGVYDLIAAEGRIDSVQDSSTEIKVETVTVQIGNPTFPPHSLEEHSDVDVSEGKQTGDALVWDGTVYKPAQVSGGGSDHSMNDHLDFDDTGGKNVGDLVQWDGSNYSPTTFTPPAPELPSNVMLKEDYDDNGNGIVLAANSISFYGDNNTGATISAGKFVYITSDRFIALADNTDSDKQKVAGMVYQDIPDGQSGIVLAIAYNFWDTTGHEIGEYLYLTTNGDLTRVTPTSQKIIIVGQVKTVGNPGVIAVGSFDPAEELTLIEKTTNQSLSLPSNGNSRDITSYQANYGFGGAVNLSAGTFTVDQTALYDLRVKVRGRETSGNKEFDLILWLVVDGVDFEQLDSFLLATEKGETIILKGSETVRLDAGQVIRIAMGTDGGESATFEVNSVDWNIREEIIIQE